MIVPKPLSEMSFRGYGIDFLPVTPCDLRCLRQWRNSPDIRPHMLDTTYITPHQQRLWYESIKGRLDQAHWVVWGEGIRCGYVNIKGTGPLDSQKRVDLGIYVGDSMVRRGLLGYAMSLMMFDIIFEYLSVSKGQSWVREDRNRVRQFDQQLGYIEKECKDGFIRLSICYSDYKKAKAKLIRFFPETDLLKHKLIKL